MTYSRDERPLTELFSDLVQDTGTLVRQEVQLAKAELTQSAAQAGRAVGFSSFAAAQVACPPRAWHASPRHTFTTGPAGGVV